MNKEKPTKRTYNSSRRKEQARLTNLQIVEAARNLFDKCGYSGATIEAIAQEAGVAADLTKSPLFFILTSLANALTVPLLPILASILYFNAKAREEKREPDIQSSKEDARVKVEDLYAKPYSDDHPENPEKK